MMVERVATEYMAQLLRMWGVLVKGAERWQFEVELPQSNAAFGGKPSCSARKLRYTAVQQK